MTDSAYYSPSQIQLFINGYHVDDACCVEWRVMDGKRPVYGYNDQEWRRVVKGRSIVQGSLDIHFRFHGYLTNVIEAAQQNPDRFPETIRELSVLKHAENADNLLDLYRNIDDPDTKAQMMRQEFERITAGATSSTSENPNTVGQSINAFARAGGEGAAFFNRLKQQYWRPKKFRDFSDSINERPGRVIDQPKFKHGFDIMVRYGELHSFEDRNTTLVIKGVQIMDAGQRISAEVPEGGAPIKERYSFIAQSIHPYR